MDTQDKNEWWEMNGASVRSESLVKGIRRVRVEQVLEPCLSQTIWTDADMYLSNIIQALRTSWAVRRAMWSKRSSGSNPGGHLNTVWIKSSNLCTDSEICNNRKLLPNSVYWRSGMGSAGLSRWGSWSHRQKRSSCSWREDGEEWLDSSLCFPAVSPSG